MTQPTIESTYDLIQELVTKDYTRFDPAPYGKRVLAFQDGQKVVKIICWTDYGHENHEPQRSVFGFIVKADDTLKSDKGAFFKRGDMLKAAGWKAPAKNFSRGNVFNLTPDSHINWTGIS